MASAIIHLCVAKEIARKLNIEDDNLLIGSIAPDIAKIVGENRSKTHYVTRNDDETGMDAFAKKYKEHLSSPFELGYFIHLYTDNLWFKEFFSKFVCDNSVKLKDGTVMNVTSDFISSVIYNDYTNLNIDLIDRYSLDLKIFYETSNITHTYIEEFPIDKIKLLLDKMGNIIINSSVKPTYVFDINQTAEFIDEAVDIIIKRIKELEILN